MRSSRLRATISRFQKPKALWPNPEQSIGKHLGKKKGKFNIWEAIGPAREIFEPIKPYITELLEYSCDPVPSSSFVLFDIFMIGETGETALPHIMFSCSHCEPRKSAVAAMKKSNILEQCPQGIHLGDWDYPPHLKDLQYLASAPCCQDPLVYTSEEHESISPHYDNNFVTVHNYSRQSMGQILQLVLQNTSTGPEYLRTATIGSVVLLSGRRFYLIPAHVCYAQSHILPDMVPESSTPEESECEFGGFEGGDEEASDSPEAEVMTHYSLTPESNDPEEDWNLDEDESTSDSQSDCLTSEVEAERPNSSIVAPGDGAYYTSEDASILSLRHSPCPNAKFPFLKSNSLDYCLLEVDETEHDMSDLPVLSRENIGQLNSGPVDVMAATGSGNILTGVLSSRLSSIRLPNGTRFINFLSVRFKDSLQPGDSGSIVRDVNTGKIYGHIVAGDTGSQIAIVVPAVDVLNDITARSTRTEATSEEHNHATFTHQRGLETTSNENGVMSVRVSRKCPFCLEDAWPSHTARHLRRVACSYPSVGGYDGSFQDSQVSGRDGIRSNNTRDLETTSQTSSGGVESINEADPEVNSKKDFQVTVKSLHLQRPDPKDEKWKVGQFSEKLDTQSASQSAQDTPLTMDTVEPDKISPISTSDGISPVRASHWNQALIQGCTVGYIGDIPGYNEDVAVKAFLDEEQDGIRRDVDEFLASREGEAEKPAISPKPHIEDLAGIGASPLNDPHLEADLPLVLGGNAQQALPSSAISVSSDPGSQTVPSQCSTAIWSQQVESTLNLIQGGLRQLLAQNPSPQAISQLKQSLDDIYKEVFEYKSNRIPPPPRLLSVNEPKNKSNNKSKVYYRCQLCGVRAGTKYSFKRHVENKHHPQYDYHCHLEHCTATLEKPPHRRDNLLEHYKRAHNLDAPPENIVERNRVSHLCPPTCVLCSLLVDDWDDFYECFVKHCEIKPASSKASAHRASSGHRKKRRRYDSDKDNGADNGGFVSQPGYGHSRNASGASNPQPSGSGSNQQGESKQKGGRNQQSSRPQVDPRHLQN